MSEVVVVELVEGSKNDESVPLVNGHKEGKSRKHKDKREKKHKDKEEKHKKHKRERHHRDRDEAKPDGEAGVFDSKRVNGAAVGKGSGAADAIGPRVRGGADSEPESGEIPVPIVAGKDLAEANGEVASRSTEQAGPSGDPNIGQPPASGPTVAHPSQSTPDEEKEKKRKREPDVSVPGSSKKAKEERKDSQKDREREVKHEERRHSKEDGKARPRAEKAEGAAGEHGKQRPVESSNGQARDKVRKVTPPLGQDDRHARQAHDLDRKQLSPYAPRGDGRRLPDPRTNRDGRRGGSPARGARGGDFRRDDTLHRDRRREDERWRGPDRYGRGRDDRRPRGGSPFRHRDREPDWGRDRRHRSRSRDRDGRGKQEDRKLLTIVEAAIKADSEDEEEKLIAERRARRQQILAKHQKQQDETDAVAAPTATEIAGRGPGAAVSAAPSPKPSEGPVDSAPGSPISDDGNELADIKQEGDLWQRGSGALENGGAADAASESPGKSSEEKHKMENQGKKGYIDIDMFADQPESEVPDMFTGAVEDAPVIPAAQRRLQDNYDDAEGYYNFQVGEIMDNRYEVYATHGKGVFSSVLRARDTLKVNEVTGKPAEVAIKVIRANDIMFKAGQTETVILRKLGGADPEGKRHVIRLLRSFEYRSHLCLVFESMDINLRELTKKYGRGIGLNVKAVHAYAHQLLWALYHLRSCGVLHADIKPDNILVNKGRNAVKLCDFGSAMFTGDNEITPYLVSRFYRSPEVILGLKYDHPMDMWSIGCVLYELFTGKILFPGKTNNEMLKLMMDVKGPFPKKMLKKAAFADKHFENDPNMSFALMEEDPVTRRPTRRVIVNPTVKHDFAALLAGSEGERRKVAQLADLLERMMHLDPDKRMNPKDALRHPFIKEQLKVS